MSIRTRTNVLAAAVAAAILIAAAPAMAQQTRTSPVTSPPSGFTGGNANNGTDSTLAGGQGIGNSGNSSVTAGGGSTPAPPTPPPGMTCFAGQTRNVSQSGGSCQAGSAAYRPYSGNALAWTQTATQTETCPAGPYGAPVWTQGPWTPANPGDPNGCGYPSGKMVQVGVNNQATTWPTTDGSTGNYGMGRKGGNPGGPSAQFSGTWTWNGQTLFVQAKCGGVRNDEFCTGSVVRNIGGVNWKFTIDGASLLPGDCYLPPRGRWDCPLNGRGSVGAL